MPTKNFKNIICVGTSPKEGCTNRSGSAGAGTWAAPLSQRPRGQALTPQGCAAPYSCCSTVLMLCSTGADGSAAPCRRQHFRCSLWGTVVAPWRQRNSCSGTATYKAQLWGKSALVPPTWLCNPQGICLILLCPLRHIWQLISKEHRIFG